MVEHCSLLKICAQQTDKKVTVVNTKNIFEAQYPVFKGLIDDELMSAQSSPVLEQEVLLILEHEKWCWFRGFWFVGGVFIVTSVY